MSTWFVTGCSSGLGRALAKELLSRGDNVVVTARDVATVQDLADAYADSAHCVTLDVTEPPQVASAVAAATQRFGGVDVLVNNAGYGYRAAIEEGDVEDVRRLFATNFFGPVGLIKAVLPSMRQARHGTIVNLSTIAVRMGPVGSGYYAASKAALEAATSSLRKELEPLGIVAMTVQPGRFRTDFFGRSLQQSAESLGDYAETAGRRRKENEQGAGTPNGDPAAAARAIIAAVEAPDTPALLVLGPEALENSRVVLRTQSTELDRWEELSRSTDFPT